MLNATLTNLGSTSNTWWNDSGLPNGTWYYVVTAINTSGESSPSNCQSGVVAIPPNLPNPPTLLSVQPNPSTTGILYLTWNQIQSVKLYNVYRSNSFITTINMTVLNLGSTSNTWWTDSGRSDGMWYYVVTAVNASGESAPSNCQVGSVATPNFGLSPPTLSIIAPDPSINGPIGFNWSVTQGASSYSVYRSNSLITILNATVSNLGSTGNTWWTDSGRLNGTWYYAVTALNASGESAPSNCQSVMVMILTMPPDPPKLSLIVPDLSTDGFIAAQLDGYSRSNIL